MHPNKKRKPKHTAVFRYHTLTYGLKIGGSKECKAVSIDSVGENVKCGRYEKYSKAIWQDTHTERKARKGSKRFSYVR